MAFNPICPNLSKNDKGEYNFPEEAQYFNELVEALGEPVAYFVHNAMGGKSVYETEQFKKILEEVSKKIPEKEGVDFVFKQNPELASIGTAEQYSKYLNTIFPNSKIKDILYHGTDNKDIIDSKGFDAKLKKDFIDIEGEYKPSGGIFLSSSKEKEAFGARDYGEQVISVIIDTKKLVKETDYEKVKTGEPLRSNDTFYKGNNTVEGFKNTKDKYSSPVIVGVKSIEQIHILGSKQDIEGFKKWKENNNIDPKTKATQIYSKTFSYNYKAPRSYKVNYKYDQEPEGQSLEARNNALIDISQAVLTDPSMLKDFINPGGYDTLSELADKVKTAKGTASEELNFFSLRTQNILAERNMTGKALVGIAANHNKNYAMRQWANISLATPITFDNKPLGNLSGKGIYKLNEKGEEVLQSGMDISGRPISKNLAEFLAAIVDNAKDPVAAFINYNLYTADIMSMIVSVGFPLETAIAFMNQPIILEIIEDIKAAPIGGENQVIKDWAKRYNLKFEKGKIPKAVDLDTEDLWNNIKGEIIMDDEDIVASFINYREMAKDFGKLIRAMRFDTQGGAAGPTLSDNIKARQAVKDLLDIKKTKHLKGINKLFDKDGPIPYLAAFKTHGIDAATDFLNEFFPNSKREFGRIMDTISEHLDRDMSVKEVEHLNAALIGYIYSKAEFYKKNDKEKFIIDFPNLILKLKSHEKFKNNDFAKHIQHITNKRKSSIPYLSFDNTKNYTPEHRQTIINGFYDMLNTDETITLKTKEMRSGKQVTIEKTYNVSDIAKDLIRYSFYASGFNFGPNSFFHLVPVEFYTEMEEGKEIVEFSDNLLDMAENDRFNEFIDQYYRNNWKKSNLVPVVEKDGKGVKGFDVAYVDGSLVLTPNASTPIQYKYKNGKNNRPYIRVKEKNNDILLKYFNNRYIEINKLGIPNIITEYEFGVDTPDSSIKTNRKNTTLNAGKGFRTDPDIKEKLFGGSNETTMTAMLGRIAYSEHVLSPLAEKLYMFSQEMEELGIKVSVDLMTYEERLQLFGDHAPATYDGNVNRIVMTSDGRYRKSSEVTAIHESFHAMTAHLLRTNSKVSEDFNKMYEYAKSKTTNPELYGYKNVLEFAAELMNNSDLIKDLQSMSPTEEIDKYDNLFQEIMSKILEILGISYSDTAYDQAVSILSHVVNYGKNELYYQNMEEASNLEYSLRLKSINGKTFVKGFEKSAEIAKELNNNQLKDTNFEAKRIKFTKENSFGKLVEVYGVSINPKTISPVVKITEGNDTMHETEIDIANTIISDREADENEKFCNL